MPAALEVLLVRHAESTPSREIPEPDWPLSELGWEQAHVLAGELELQPSVALYASSYLRARQTLEPLAAHHGLPIQTEPDVRERKLADGLVEDWPEQLRRSWADHSYCLPGGESARDCQLRVIRGVTRIADQATTAQVVIGSHGNAISLFLNHLDPAFGYEQWRNMGNPAVFRLTYDGNWHRH